MMIGGRGSTVDCADHAVSPMRGSVRPYALPLSFRSSRHRIRSGSHQQSVPNVVQCAPRKMSGHHWGGMMMTRLRVGVVVLSFSMFVVAAPLGMH